MRLTLAKQIRIADVVKIASSSQDRRGQIDTLVFYSVEGDTPGSLILHSTDPSLEEIKSAIARDLEFRSQVVGHKFEV